MISSGRNVERVSPSTPSDVAPGGKTGPNPLLSNGIAAMSLSTPLRISLADAPVPRNVSGSSKVATAWLL